MSVYDENMKKIGKVKEIAMDLSHSIVLVITKIDGNEINIKWNQIKKFGEIILIGGQTNATIPSESASTPEIGQNCPSCGFSNKAGSKFCENCGTKV